ncbi:hypothetical protein BDD43_4068 [Mucilaginibacter gracilis]|uniref:Uncharacterized protein n=1 Tax=Mucilaginibacter gracilis TaxID=423350 RepID=A0A495J527_9SPHI|nr:hypothetical protein [Mucilaginibacter gracilis]RKR83853.1 hypothetical protein BDD43_4068 [Mucilaginibacter gracilis]
MKIVKIAFSFISMMAILFVTKVVSGQTTQPNVLFGCYFQPAVIRIQGDTIAAVGFAQSAAVYIMNLKEPKANEKLELLKQAKLERKFVCIYVKKNTVAGATIITDVKLAPIHK